MEHFGGLKPTATRFAAQRIPIGMQAQLAITYRGRQLGEADYVNEEHMSDLHLKL